MKTLGVTFVSRGVLALLLGVAAATACSGQKEAAPPAATALRSATTDAPISATASPYDALPESVRNAIGKPFTDDFDEMVKRRAIRVAVTFNRTHYFIDEGQERGVTYESLKLFEKDLNTDLKTGNLKVHVVIVPMSRDQLYPALANGTVDMVAAMVTVRPEVEKLVAFSTPTRTNVSGVVIYRTRAPPIATSGRPGGSGGVCPKDERLLRDARTIERAIDGPRLANHGDQRSPRCARRR
jgi:ABC-type amino acid transport substrate-binding protein